MIEGAHLHVTANRGVRKNKVEALNRELREQPMGLVAVADDLHGLREPHGWHQEPVRDELGKHVRDSYPKSKRPRSRSILDRVDQLVPEVEDLVGIPKHHVAIFGQHELAARAVEQLKVEGLLERPYLPADRRLRQLQRLCRPCDAVFLGHHPEVEQMMIVQPFHCIASILRIIRSYCGPLELSTGGGVDGIGGGLLRSWSRSVSR